MRPLCPRCDSENVVPILYGLVGLEAEAQEQRGEIAVGGCEPQNERWACRSCGHRWPV